jgi:MFS family permease
MGEDVAKDKGGDPSSLPLVPGKGEGPPETRTDARKGRARRRLLVWACSGAAVGVVCAIAEAPGWFRLPEQSLGMMVGSVPGLPDWVFDWVCPIIGWGIIGTLAAGALTVRLTLREKILRRMPKSRAGKVLGAAGVVAVTAGAVLALVWVWLATRWSIKTATDADAWLVDLKSPVKTDVATLAALSRPTTLPYTRRVSPVEITVYVVAATLVQYKREPDGDYHLLLMGKDGSTMIAEIPNPRFVSERSPVREPIVKARAAVTTRYHVTTSWQETNVPVVVTGIGLFDVPHGQDRPAPNFIELHPLLAIKYILSSVHGPFMRSRYNPLPGREGPGAGPPSGRGFHRRRIRCRN